MSRYYHHKCRCGSDSDCLCSSSNSEGYKNCVQCEILNLKKTNDNSHVFYKGTNDMNIWITSASEHFGIDEEKVRTLVIAVMI
jgi:hypothetical protein